MEWDSSGIIVKLQNEHAIKELRDRKLEQIEKEKKDDRKPFGTTKGIVSDFGETPIVRHVLNAAAD